MSATVQLLPSPLTTTGLTVGDALTSSLSIAIDARHGEIRRAMCRVDLSAAARRTLEATGLHDRVMLHSGGLTWRPAGTRGRVDVTVDLQIEAAEAGGSYLHVVTRFTASDERSRARLLDSWAVIGPVAEALVRRAAQTVKEAAEADVFDEHDVSSQLDPGVPRDPAAPEPHRGILSATRESSWSTSAWSE